MFKMYLPALSILSSLSLFFFSTYAAPSSKTDLNLVPLEVYIAVYPSTGVINIIEYDLQDASSDGQSVESKVDELRSLVKTGKYSINKYKFKNSSLAEEKIKFDDARNIIIGEYWFRTENKNLELFKDTFSVFLNKDVDVSYSQKTLSLEFKKGEISIRNSEHGTGYTNKTHEKIVWKDSSPNYDAVFSIDRSNLKLSPISPYFLKQERFGSEGVFIDGSSGEAFQSSMASMLQGAHPNSAKKFNIALLKIAIDTEGNLKGDNLDPADESLEHSSRLMGEKLNNLSFNEVIAMGDSIKVTKEMKKLITDFEETGTSRDYQHDADKVRLIHITYLGGLIDQYHKKTGKYPLASDTEQYVFFVSESQKKFATNNQSYLSSVPVIEFKRQIELELEKEVTIPYDPQLGPVHSPNFYVYKAGPSGYTLTAHLFDGEGISKKIAPYYYEVNISNNSNHQESIFTYQELLGLKKYKAKLKAAFKVRAPKNPEQVGLVSLD